MMPQVTGGNDFRQTDLFIYLAPGDDMDESGVEVHNEGEQGTSMMDAGSSVEGTSGATEKRPRGEKSKSKKRSGRGGDARRVQT